MSRKFLYRRLGLAVILLFFSVFAVPSGQAQRPELKRPMDAPEEKPAETQKKKKQKGPRAVGLLQLGSKGKATLIPVAILVDGRFYDASAYKADPVPMALEGGTVYEAEQAGESQGIFTVNGVLHNKNLGSVNPWMATGSFLPRGTEAPKTTHTAEDVPVGMDNSGDEPPRLTKNKASKTETPDSKSATAAGSGSDPSSSSPGTSDASDKTKGTAPTAGQAGGSSAGSSAGTSAGAAGSPSSGQDSQKRDVATSAKAEGPAGDSQPSSEREHNYYRPTLRRGKPTEPAPQEVEAAPNAGKADTPASTTAAQQDAVQFVAAISDAGGPDPRPYKFYWKEGEEEERRKQLLALAGDEVRIYANALARNAISANPAAPKAAGATRKAGAKPVQPVFENVQFRVFDIWANNQPVMIWSAEAHFPATPNATTPPQSYNITLVARTDIYGSLRKLYSGVTDRFHLDVTPRLELIDAVDADGDGRGELLFRKTSDAGSGYVIYRATPDKLFKMFDSVESQ